jgi:hypothetical protein
MEANSVQWQKIMLELENTCLQQKEKFTKVNFDMENCTHELWVQIQKLKGNLKTLLQITR